LNESNKTKTTDQTEETKRKPLFHIVVGLALLLLAVVLLIRGINGIRLQGLCLGVIINFLGTLLFSVVSAMMLSDLIQALKAKVGKKS